MPETPHALADYGWTDRWAAVAADQQSLTSTPARVLRHDGHAVLVGGDDGVRQVHLRKVFPPVAVGDFVLVDGEVVVQILDRQGLLQRASADGSAAQPIAANVDVVAIVCGLDRPLRTGRIERFVTLAWDSGSVPLVVLTKADLADDTDAAVTAAMSAAPGAEVLAVSSAAVTGLDELRGLLADRTVVFVGESGAGKSSLLNALAGSDLMKTGAVRRGDHKGHHTTTARELHVLAGGIRVIDTPGVRAVLLTVRTTPSRDVPCAMRSSRVLSAETGSARGSASGEKPPPPNCAPMPGPRGPPTADSAKWSKKPSKTSVPTAER
jgi:ribosome biogenesis GTPase